MATASRASRQAFPLLSPTEVLRSMLALSREVNADMRESDLVRILYHSLRELLPGRLVAVRSIDPHTLRAVEILADEALVPEAVEMPPTIIRKALRHPNVRDNLPADVERNAQVRIVDEHPILFRDAELAFTVPLIAGGEITGEVHVNYRRPAGADPGFVFPIRQDKGLVIPVTNHIAAVAHTRRLLHETAYLQDYLDQLIDQANVLIVATDLAGRITVWNRAMNRLTGFTRAQATGRDLLQWLSQLGAKDLAMIMRQVAGGGEPATREVKLPSSGGAVLRAAFNVVSVRGAGGQADAVLAIGQDVTAMRALQNQVIHAEKLATVGQIAAGVAHEINNPLTSVQVCVEAVLRKSTLALEGRVPNAFEPADVDRLKKIREGAERIGRFAKDLVSYARPSGSEFAPVHLNEVVEQALSFCEHVLDQSGAKLDRDLYTDLPVVYAIRDQLLQIVINLVTNAAQALTRPGGTIRVRTWRQGDRAVGLAVSDTGSGIREEDRPHIFEPFFTTKPPGRGTGLGLSIVRNIVYAHGGQISFQTRQGGGTTFVVTLPTSHLGAGAGTQGGGSAASAASEGSAVPPLVDRS